ncbi:dihydrofolate reductase family protein [Nitrospira sp. Nam74]
MRRIRIIEQISLAGVIQVPGGRYEDSDYPHGGRAMRISIRPWAKAKGRRFDLLLGRRTYDIFAGHWPKVENDPIADGLNAATKYVATHRPDSLGWGSVKDLGADIMERVRGVKSKDGPNLIVWGSSTLTPVLLEQGLVDEILLFVYPVLLGRGKRLFSDSADPRELALVSAKPASSGVLMNTYRPVGSLRAG